MKHERIKRCSKSRDVTNPCQEKDERSSPTHQPFGTVTVVRYFPLPLLLNPTKESISDLDRSSRRVGDLEILSLENIIHRNQITLHVENIRLCVIFGSDDPDHFLDLVNQFVNDIFGVSNISEGTGTGGAGAGTGSDGFPLGKPCLPTEVTFIDGAAGFAEMTGIIGAGQHTGLAADTFFTFHLDDAGPLIFVGCSGRTTPITGGIVTMIAEYGVELDLSIEGTGIFFGQNSGAILRWGDVVCLAATMHTQLTVDTDRNPHDHTVVRIVRVFFDDICSVTGGNQ